MTDNKIQEWQVKEKCRELGKLCDSSEYGDEKFMELYQVFVDYLGVSDYLESRFNGIDLYKDGCPLCKKSSDVLEIGKMYENLSEENKKIVYKFLQFLIDN